MRKMFSSIPLVSVMVLIGISLFTVYSPTQATELMFTIVDKVGASTQAMVSAVPEVNAPTTFTLRSKFGTSLVQYVLVGGIALFCLYRQISGFVKVWLPSFYKYGMKTLRLNINLSTTFELLKVAWVVTSWYLIVMKRKLILTASGVGESNFLMKVPWVNTAVPIMS